VATTRIRMHEQSQVLKARAFEPIPRPKDVVFIFNKKEEIITKYVF